MALGLLVLAAMIAGPIALTAWLFGLVTFGQAVLAYMGLGWAILGGGLAIQALLRGPKTQPVPRCPERCTLVDLSIARGN